MDLFEEIKKIIVKEFAIGADEVMADAHLQDDLGGDSLILLNLSESISKRYGIKLVSDDLIEIENVGDLVKLVKSKIQQ